MADPQTMGQEGPVAVVRRGVMDPDTLHRRILAEQVSLLYKSPVPLITNLVNAALLVAVMWSTMKPIIGLAWFAVMVLVVGGRHMLRKAFLQRRDEASDERWASRFVIGITLSGALWGATSYVVLALDSPLHDMFVGLIAAGMVAGAVAVAGIHLRSFYGFLLPCIVPMILAFVSTPDLPHVAMGATMVVYGIVSVITARSFNASLIETLTLRIHNADLARDLAVARDIAEAASRTNADTLAHLGHELRTPLNAIAGFSEIMRRRLFGPLGHSKYDGYAKHISESTGHLTRLIEEILRFSRGYSGTLELETMVVNTGAEIEQCIEMVAESAEAVPVTLAHIVAPDLPRLQADAVKLRQILLNLLTNAIKFTPPKGQVLLIAKTDNTGAIVITVRDTGVGIDDANLARVLEPYVQIDNAMIRKHRGLGLGLPLVKRFVELHDGTLTLESEPGAGTTVTVRFPPARSVPQETERPSDASGNTTNDAAA